MLAGLTLKGLFQILYILIIAAMTWAVSAQTATTIWRWLFVNIFGCDTTQTTLASLLYLMANMASMAGSVVVGMGVSVLAFQALPVKLRR